MTENNTVELPITIELPITVEFSITAETGKGPSCFEEEGQVRIGRRTAAPELVSTQANHVSKPAIVPRTCITCQHEPEWHPATPLAVRDVGICRNKNFRDPVGLCKTGDICTHCGFVVSDCPAWAPKLTDCLRS